MPTRFIEQLTQQAGTSALGGIMGMALGAYNDNRQEIQQRRLQNLQLAGEKGMVDYNMMKQLQLWKDTNYSAQMEQLRKAGLNPGLLYGMGGGGGQSTGTPTGNVTAGTAQQNPGDVQSIIAMGLQNGLLAEQRKLIEAERRKVEAETTKTTGVDTQKVQTEIQSLTQGINNQKAQEWLTKAQTRIQEIDANVKTESMQDTIDYIAWQTSKALEELQQAGNETYIQRATMNNKIDTVKAEMLYAFLRNALTKAQTENVKAGTQKTYSDIQVNLQALQNMSQKIVQDWRALELKGIDTSSNEYHKMHEQWQNDIQESTKLPQDVIEKAIQAIILKNIISPDQKRNPVGFKY